MQLRSIIFYGLNPGVQLHVDLYGVKHVEVPNCTVSLAFQNSYSVMIVVIVVLIDSYFAWVLVTYTLIHIASTNKTLHL